MTILKWICIVVLVSCGLVYGQEDDFNKAERTYKENKLDSAIYHIDKAANRYKKQSNTDSLVFAIAHKARVLVDNEGLKEAGELMEGNMPMIEQLPPKSIARVAAYNRIGQIRSYQYMLEEAGRWFDKAMEAMDPAQPTNKHYVALYNGISQLYLTKQQYSLADDYIKKAYQMNLEVEGRDGALMVNIWQMRYFTSYYKRDYNQALQDGLELERVIQLHYPPTHPNIGMMHNSLSEVYLALSLYEKALYHQHLAVDIHYNNYLKTGNHYTLAGAYGNLGGVYYTLHEYYLADECLTKAKDLLESTFGEYGPGTVETLIMLGSTRQKLNRVAQAQEIFEQAYRLQKKHAPYERYWIAYIEAYYGDFYFDQNRFAEAIDYYQRAIKNYSLIGEENSYYGLYAKAYLGTVLGYTEAWESALDLQQEALDDFRRYLPQLESDARSFLGNISTTYSNAGQFEQALAYSDSVFLDLLESKKMPEKPSEWMSRLPYSFNSCGFVSNRVSILWDLYKQTNHTHYLDQILGIIDSYGSFFAGNLYTFRSQASLIEQADLNKSIYAIGIASCWRLSDMGSDKTYTAKALEYAERSKAMLLRLASNNLMVDASRSGEDKIANRDHTFRTRIGSLNDQYLNTEHGSDSLLHLLSFTMEDYRQFQDSLKQSGHESFLAKYDMKPYGVAGIQSKLLHKGQTLIQYAVTEESVYSFLITKDDFRMKRMDRDALQNIGKMQNLHTLSAKEFSTPAYGLYRALLAPLEPYFDGSKLLIIPDADLHYLNFELLIFHEEDGGFGDMPYLIHTYDISYLLSASSAIQFKEAYGRGAKRSRALLFAPVFSDQMKADFRQALSGNAMADDDYYFLSRQPFSLQTAKRIGRFFANDLYAEQNAKENVFKRSAKDYSILHLGTHAEVNDVSPLQSRLFFAKALPDDTTDTDDGYLHAYEIYSMQLRAELAVLTACETGLGLLRQGEGVMSLAHSFMHAGCPSVVMSLWKIDEKTSADIVAKFYEYLSKGIGKSEALRRAKLDFLRTSDDELKHPYYWAGLTLIGDAGPVYRNHRWQYWIAGLAVLVGGSFWLYSRRKKYLV